MGRPRPASPIAALIGIAAVALAGHSFGMAAIAFLYVPIVVWSASHRSSREALATAGAAVIVEAILRSVTSGARGAVEVVLLAAGLMAALAAVSTLRSRLQALSLTDPLTGLPNRLGWEMAMERESRRAARQAYPLTVVQLDVDGFRAFNASRGHTDGDEVLRSIAAVWSASLRATDLFARLGRDEFAIGLAGTHDEGALEMLGRIRRGVPYGITVSAGVAEWDGAEGMADLMARAEAALETARSQGPGATMIAPAAYGERRGPIAGDPQLVAP